MELFVKLRFLFNAVVRWFRPNGHHVAEPAHPDTSARVGVGQVEHGGPAIDPYPTEEVGPPPVSEGAAPPGSGVHTHEVEKRDIAPVSSEEKLEWNRALRRKMSALERKRRKLDKFVKPQGPEPVHITRSPRKSDTIDKPKPPTPAQIGEAEIPIADTLEGQYVEIKESELYGEFNFRDSILDQLDRYWVYLARMKKHDPDSYGLYRQIGAHIVPHVATNTHLERDDVRIFTPEELVKYKQDIFITPWFHETRPSFGCVAWATHSVAEKVELTTELPEDHGRKLWMPKFLYFTKYKRPPPEVQPMSGGDVYAMTVWWDRPHDPEAMKGHKWGVPNQFAIFVSADGTHLEALRMISTKRVQIRHKTGYDHGSLRGHTFTIPQREWRIPSYYERWSKDLGLNVQDHLCHLFCTASRIVETANYSMARIEVHKDDLTAVFGVNIKRMSYFFQDRDYVLTESGTRKRVFHCVRPFVRKDGKAIKMHFRGMRDFTWAGYQVHISVPGLDHFMLPEIDIGTEDEFWQDKKEKYLTEEEFGKRLVEGMQTGLGAIRR